MTGTYKTVTKVVIPCYKFDEGDFIKFLAKVYGRHNFEDVVTIQLEEFLRAADAFQRIRIDEMKRGLRAIAVPSREFDFTEASLLFEKCLNARQSNRF
jgi:hypothetical protein